MKLLKLIPAAAIALTALAFNITVNSGHLKGQKELNI